MLLNCNVNRKAILIADDEEIGLYTLTRLLGGKYTNILAKNGKEAFDMFINENPDLILMDVMMPEFDGIWACEKIKSIKPDIPVIAVTARAMPFEKEEILKHGFDDYISKPIDDELLHQMIEKYLFNR